ncbi:hypothetical protein SAMN05660874_00819 [Saccharopolyspora flava]|uniref:Uncharacterized protein n=1 Tax=Saccharopolyspora flava TaxID=95161 RepID=A0A1I6PII3_9PSEU|nr:hypothetical protein SAMN05660874_00819 [Saccharopolyspora flava]
MTTPMARERRPSSTPGGDVRMGTFLALALGRLATAQMKVAFGALRRPRRSSPARAGCGEGNLPVTAAGGRRSR